jgi:hypothetical protein
MSLIPSSKTACEAKTWKKKKIKLISHYFPAGITIDLREEGAHLSENWLIYIYKKKTHTGINLCILYKRKLVNRLLVCQGITVYECTWVWCKECENKYSWPKFCLPMGGQGSSGVMLIAYLPSTAVINHHWAVSIHEVQCEMLKSLIQHFWLSLTVKVTAYIKETNQKSVRSDGLLLPSSVVLSGHPAHGICLSTSFIVGVPSGLSYSFVTEIPVKSEFSLVSHSSHEFHLRN